MLSLASQVLIRNEQHFDQGRWALVNPEDPHIFAELKNVTHGFHHFFDVFKNSKSFSNDEVKHRFSAAFTLEADEALLDGAVIYMPKAKQVLNILLDNLSCLIKPEGKIYVVGENKAGVKSASKLMEKYLSAVIKQDGAKHCSLFSGTLEENKQQFDINKYLLRKTFSINEQDITLCSLPGVFGHKQLDDGTALLLQQFADAKEVRQMRGNFYDFACGTGVIACYFKKLNSKLKVTCSDISALATYCTEQSLLANELEAKVQASDGMDEIHEYFDYIVSNPPFHSGIKNDYLITEKFIKDAYQHSKSNASLTIVANRFLAYPDCLDTTYGKFQTLNKTNKFAVYTAKKS